MKQLDALVDEMKEIAKEDAKVKRRNSIQTFTDL